MKHVNEYRDKEICETYIKKIWEIHKKEIRLMEVCGTHTMAISKNGIRSLLPKSILLLSGPGCPVCVTAQQEIDKFIKLAGIDNVIVATFGDLMRVPGSNSSLQKERAEGADVRIVYSTLDCLQISEKNPHKEVVFLGVGFETTVPTIAASILEAHKKGIKNFSVIAAHKLVPPALTALMENENVKIDGFICPGHASVIIGGEAYVPTVENYHVPCVVAGFEPVDILQSIYMLVAQIENSCAKVEIAYKRAVNFGGNKKARDIMYQVFEPHDANWRGIGVIPESGLIIREEFNNFNAERKFDVTVENVKEPKGCACGDILIGIKSPPECLLFRKACTPDHPIGPCMVSSEGTCAAYYKYHTEGME